MFSGYEIPGTKFIVPALSGRDAIRFEDAGYFKRIEGDSHPAVRHALIKEIVHAAMTRNYPNVTAEDVEPLVTVENMVRLYWAAQGMPTSTIEETWAKVQANPRTPQT
jgi:hypothetical protein